MRIHREGKNILVTAAIILVLLFIVLRALSFAFFLIFVLLIPLLMVYFLIIWFFRIPLRKFTGDEKTVFAPADGKIVVVEETFEPEYFRDNRIQVSVFMSPLNVHQNTWPVSGNVTYTKYHKGKYLVAWHPKSSVENERSTVVIEMKDGTEILVRQIAGAVARRICTYAREDQKVKQGDELGFIKFGSRVDIFLPLTANVHCKPGDRSRNNTTVLAVL